MHSFAGWRSSWRTLHPHAWQQARRAVSLETNEKMTAAGAGAVLAIALHFSGAPPLASLLTPGVLFLVYGVWRIFIPKSETPRIITLNDLYTADGQSAARAKQREIDDQIVSLTGELLRIDTKIQASDATTDSGRRDLQTLSCRRIEAIERVRKLRDQQRHFGFFHP
jgi:hypothetical protein